MYYIYGFIYIRKSVIRNLFIVIVVTKTMTEIAPRGTSGVPLSAQIPGGSPPPRTKVPADLKFSLDTNSGLEKAVHDNKEFFRRPGSEKLYLRIDNGLECTGCGSEVAAAKVIRAIWDGLFPCSGSGQTMQSTVPYCPGCEEKPSPYGLPITVSDT